MILEVKQTSASGNNSFEIMCNNELCYHAQASWLPMMTDSTRKIVLNDKNGNMIFETKYSLLDNMLEESIPMKYLVTKEQKFDQYQIIDTSGNVVGAFYVEQNRVADKKIIMAFDGHVILGYKRELGLYEAVSLYENDVQIGQITKSSRVVNNLDQYYVHFLDQYNQYLPIISMFTVYYDYLYHNNSGEIFKGVTVGQSYTYDFNNAKYNDDFIGKNFGEAEKQRIDDIMKKDNVIKIGKLSLNKFWLLFASIWIFVILFIAGVFALICYANGGL